MVDLKEAEERVILVGVALYDIEEMEHSLEELKELVTTAGAVSLGNVHPEPRAASIPALISARESWTKSEGDASRNSEPPA